MTMVTLKNLGSALRVVYDINGKMKSIPPTGQINVMLSEGMAKRIKRAMDKGEKLHITEYDPPELEKLNPDEPIATPPPENEPLNTDTERRNFQDPAPPAPIKRGERNNRRRQSA